MKINMHVISTSVNIPICTPIEDIQAAIQQNADFQRLKLHIIQGWTCKKTK